MHMIKVIEDDNTPGDVGEVEKIINHKILNKKYSFLVKWKGEEIESWIPESNFNNMELIYKYKSGLEKGPITRGRMKLLDANAVIFTMIMLFLLPLSLGQEQSHNLELVLVPYCTSHSEKQPILLSSFCNTNYEAQKKGRCNN